MKVVTPFNFDPENILYKSFNRGRVITKPDEALTPREVLIRYGTGNLAGINTNEVYYDVPIGSPAVLSLDSSISHRRAVSKLITEAMREAEAKLQREAVAQRKAAEEAAKLSDKARDGATSATADKVS